MREIFDARGGRKYFGFVCAEVCAESNGFLVWGFFFFFKFKKCAVRWNFNGWIFCNRRVGGNIEN